MAELVVPKPEDLDMSLKRDVAAYLRGAAPDLAFPASALTDVEASAAHLARLRRKRPAETSEAVARVWETEVKEGLRVRVYEPDSSGQHPVVVYLHGGGWVLGDLDMHDATCRRIAVSVPSTVVNVGYRLAPEHSFPVPLDDCFAATAWASRYALELSGDADNIVVAGSSAGGNLAAAVALMARDLGGPKLALQVLVYPVIDASMKSVSYKEYGDGFGLDRAQMEWFWSQYLPDDGLRRYPLASPCYAKSLGGLPPALIITAECDPLRDEGEEYARRLQRAGVDVELLRYDGQIHGFVGLVGVLGDAEIALGQIAAKIAALQRL